MSFSPMDPDKLAEGSSEGVGVKPNVAGSSRASGQPFGVRRFQRTAAADMYGAAGAPPGAQKQPKVPKMRRSRTQGPKPDDM